MSRADRIFAAVFAISLLVAPTAQAANITPTTFADDNTINGNCTLREAVRSANLNGGVDNCQTGTGADTITLAAGVYGLSVGPTGEQAAASGDLDLTDPDGLSIAGDPAGSTVDAGGIDRVFEVITPATASFDRLTIRGGANGGPGGGIETNGIGARATVTRSTVSGNSGVPRGGGLDVLGGATLTIIDSTVAANTAPGPMSEGGGINAETGAVLNVINSTVSGNSATADGGGIHVIGLTTPTVNVLSSTITANSAANGGGTFPEAGNTVNLKGSILAGNTGTASGPDCGDALNSQGNNMIGTTAGCVVTPQGTDIIGQAPGLAPLADNGGSTQTHALAANSPAIGKGPADAPAADQRGVARSAPDIGAYELTTCLGIVVNRVGSSAADILTGTGGTDGFLLLEGNDTASGLGGNDAFCGAGGNDILKGSAGNDKATGDVGKDKLIGGPGKDKLKGGAGKDSLFGNTGKDSLFGGAGKDRLNGGAGKDKLKGQGGRDSCKGGAGKDKASGCERHTKIP
jgi:CSLREA domain-containing protein